MLSPEDWMIEIENGLEYRRQFGKEDAWNQLELDYTNDEESNCNVGANLIYSMGDALYSSLCVPDPEFLISPEHPSGVDRAPVVEAVDNWLIKKLKIKREVDDAILHSYLFSRAILKIGYDSEFGWSPYYDIGTQDNLAGLTLTQFDKKGNRIEFGSAQPGMPWISAVLPHDIVVPWGVKNLDDAPWIAHRVIRLNSFIKKDPKYKNHSRLEPNMSMEGFVNSYGHVMAKRRRDAADSIIRKYSGEVNSKNIFNVLWEIHDKMTGRVYVISPNYDKFLRDSIDALQIDGLPFVSGTLVKHPRSFWGTPQAFYLGQIQANEEDIASIAYKQRRVNILRFLANEKAMSKDEVDKLISGDVGAVAFTKGTTPIREAFVPVAQGSNMQLALESNANRANARDAIGFSRNQLGEYDDSSRRTAREATFVKQGSELRTSKRTGMVVDLYIDAITKINKICFTYWKLPRYMMVGNEWVRFTGEEIEGDYLYDVTLSTKRNLSRAQRKIEAMQMMTQLAQIPGIDLNAMKQYIIDASADPAFPTILGLGTRGQQIQDREPVGREPASMGGA
ncbi:MAG: hypothetical protein DRO16_05600 [Thermoprotei archaeon]|nr:MAG: hypothetical protein DRO16_05600 [Thermoprotei archaeon]